jgi:ParB-like chromosome segregation protein Spo0J
MTITKLEKYQMLPELPPEQFAALRADIAERGVVVPVVVDEFGAILDGHNRVRACRELGINDYPVEVRAGLSEEEKRVFARRLNVLRRHLSRDQVRELIGDQLRETPEWSNNRIAAALGVDDKTVAGVRTDLAATSEIPKLDRLVGADGKARPTRQPGGRRRRQSEDAWDDPVKRAKFETVVELIKEGVVDPNSEKVQKLLREASSVVFETPGYDPFAGQSEEEKRDWHLLWAFLSYDPDAGRNGGEPEQVARHIEWLLPFRSVAKWLGEDGDKWRKLHGYSRWRISEQFKIDWAAFLDEHRDSTLADVEAELKTLQEKCEQARAAIHSDESRKRRRRGAA